MINPTTALTRLRTHGPVMITATQAAEDLQTTARNLRNLRARHLLPMPPPDCTVPQPVWHPSTLIGWLEICARLMGPEGCDITEIEQLTGLSGRRFRALVRARLAPAPIGCEVGTRRLRWWRSDITAWFAPNAGCRFPKRRRAKKASRNDPTPPHGELRRSGCRSVLS